MMETSQTNFGEKYEPCEHDRVELKNGRILDVIHGCYFDSGTRIIVRDGKIESMPGIAGERTHIKPDYCIDLQGRTVLPGLFNTHIHGPETPPSRMPGLRDRSLAKKHQETQIAKNMAECLAHGVTNVRHAGFVADLRVNRDRTERFSKAEIPVPRIMQAVVVGPTGSYMQEDLPLWLKAMGMPQVDPSKDYAAAVAFSPNATEQEVRKAVDIAIDERGADVIKIGDESFSMIANKPVPVMTLEQLKVVADHARSRGVQSTMHHSTVESFRRGVQAGVSSLVHVPFDAPLPNADVEAFKESGCLLEPTLSAFYPAFSWKLPGNQTSYCVELDRLTEFRQKTYTFGDIADEFYIPELRAGVMNGYKKCARGKLKVMGIVDMSGFYAWDNKAAFAFENFALLYEHGVPMATGNDTIPPCTPAMVDLELLMCDHVLKSNPERKLLSGAEAARIATINSAKALGIEEDFGSIERGKTVDLVILDGDPLEDFRLIGSRAAALFMDGKLVINNCGLEAKSSRKIQNRDKVSL